MTTYKSSQGKHFLFACAITFALLGLNFILQISNQLFEFEITHQTAYSSGKALGASHFFCIYFCILIRLLLTAKSKIINIMLATLCLLFILPIFPLILYLSDVIFQWSNIFNSKEWSNFFNGIISNVPVIGIIMAITPLLIPFQLLLEIKRLYSTDIKTGIFKLDDYLVEQKKSTQLNPQQTPEVLFVEDDVTCATVVLKFCNKFKLQCLHVESLDKADEAFQKFQPYLRLLIIDNFVRISPDKDLPFKTGSEWVLALKEQFPSEQRNFHVAMITGHTHMLADLKGAADIVLQKPWEPKELFKFMKEKGIL